MKPSFFLILLHSLSSIFLFGCASTPKDHGLFLENYSELKRQKGSYVHSWQEKENEKPITHIIFLHDLKWLAEEKLADDAIDRLNKFFKRRIRKFLVESVDQNIVLVSEREELDQLKDKTGIGIYVIEIAVTDLRPGNGFLRYFVGFGLGTSGSTLEAKATHYQTGTEMQFQRFESWIEGYGNVNLKFYTNMKVFSNEYCLLYALNNASKLIIEDLLKKIQPADKPWYEN